MGTSAGIVRGSVSGRCGSGRGQSTSNELAQLEEIEDKLDDHQKDAEEYYKALIKLLQETTEHQAAAIRVITAGA